MYVGGKGNHSGKVEKRQIGDLSTHKIHSPHFVLFYDQTERQESQMAFPELQVVLQLATNKTGPSFVLPNDDGSYSTSSQHLEVLKLRRTKISQNH